MLKGIFHKPVLHILLIIILGLIAYSNTFEVPFYYDDLPHIVENPIVKDLGYFIEPSKAETFQGYAEYPMLKNRYIAVLTFALNYKFHGLNVVGYHVVNLLIHILTTLLLYALIVLTFRTPFLRDGQFKEYSNAIALLSALLFVSHPIQTQAITYISQRHASLATFFYLLTIVMYIKARLYDSEDAGKFSKRKVNFKLCSFYLIAIISAVLAMKTKEIAFTIPITAAVYEFVFFKGKPGKRILYLLPLFLTMFIIPLSLIDMDKPLQELLGEAQSKTIVRDTISRTDYLLTEFRVLITYIRLIFMPLNQNLDYDYPIYSSFLHPSVFLSFFALAFIFGLGIFLLYRYRNTVTHTRLIAFGIFWFFITLLVESTLIPLLPLYEHRMYLPSIGLFISLSTSIFVFVERYKERWKNVEKINIFVLSIIIVILAMSTYSRNKVWHTEISLWEDVVLKSPGKTRAHNNLGNAYRNHGLIDEAVEQYSIAIKLNPAQPNAYNNLGNIYQEKGRVDDALQLFKIAIKLKPDYVKAYFNSGLAYKSKGMINEAIESYMTAVKLEPDYFSAHHNLGNAYVAKGLLTEAVKYYKIALNINPNNPDVHNNLGVVYRETGATDKAIKEFLIAIKNKPAWVKPHFNLGRLYLIIGDKISARQEFEAVLKLDPKHSEARRLFNLTAWKH